MSLIPLLIALPALCAPQQAHSIPSHQVLVKVENPIGLIEGLKQHGLYQLLEDDEMADFLDELRPLLARNGIGLDKEPQAVVLGITSESADIEGIPLLGLDDFFPDGIPTLPFPSSIDFTVGMLDADGMFLRDEPTFTFGLDLREHMTVWEQTTNQLFSALNAKRSAMAAAGEDHSLPPACSLQQVAGSRVWTVDSGRDRGYVAFGNGRLAISNQMPFIAPVLAGAELSDSHVWEGLATDDGDGSVRLFVDVAALVKAAFVDEPETVVPLTVMGLDSWEWASLRVDPEANGLHWQAHLEADGSRGVLAALSNEASPAELMSGLPARADAGFGVTIDPAELFASFKGWMTEIDPEGADQFDEEMASMKQTLGFDAEEFAGMFGGRFTASVRVPHFGMPMPEWFVDVEMSSPTTGKRLLDMLWEIAEGNHPYDRPTLLKSGREAWYVVDLQELGAQPYRPAMTFEEDRILFASSPAALESWLSEAGGEDQLLGYFAALEQQGPATGVLAVDFADVAATLYQAALPFLQMGLGAAAKGEIDPALLPSAEPLRKHLPPLVRRFRIHSGGVDAEGFGVF